MTRRTDILTHTAEIEVDHATAMRAYVARPAEDARPAGVIVNGELFGISAHVCDVCERLAGLGYLALAPDLHHRTAPGIELPHDAAGRERGMELLQQMTRDQVLDDVRAATDHLRAQGSDRAGVVGLSVGGHVAYLAATELDLAAVAVLYGGWIPSTDIPLSRPDSTIARTAPRARRVPERAARLPLRPPPNLRPHGSRGRLAAHRNAPARGAAMNLGRRVPPLPRHQQALITWLAIYPTITKSYR